jgi:hypothetical protein
MSFRLSAWEAPQVLGRPSSQGADLNPDYPQREATSRLPLGSAAYAQALALLRDALTTNIIGGGVGATWGLYGAWKASTGSGG